MSDYLVNRILLRRLPEYAPEMWHQIAMNWNWDNGMDILRWIVSQLACDKGTALLIYWRAGPRYFSQYADRAGVDTSEVETYDLTREIESKYTSDFYKDEHISFDPRNDDGTDWTNEYATHSLKQPIPEIMYRRTNGGQLPRMALEEGYPSEVLQEAESSQAST